MQPVADGLWLVLGASMVLGALAASGAASDVVGILRRAGAWLLAFFAMTPAMFAVLRFFGGLALLAWQSYQYLRFGNWPAWTLAHVLYFLGVKYEYPVTGWVGVDQIVRSVLNWCALSGLLVIVPVAVLVVLGITMWLLASLWKASQ